MSTPRIDVHAHFLPDFYRQALIEAGQIHPDGMPAIPDWSEQAALDVMDTLGIQTAMLSISSPGVYFGDAYVILIQIALAGLPVRRCRM